MASPKFTIIDLLQQYLKQGQKPPEALLRAAAESEEVDPEGMTLKGMGKGNAATDPINLATGAYAFGPLQELANESVGAGMGSAIPKLLKMAQRPVSGPANPLRGGGAPTVAEFNQDATNPLKGIQLPGGAVAAKGTSPLGNKVATTKTGKLDIPDAEEMTDFLEQQDQADAADELFQNLMADAPPSVGQTQPFGPTGQDMPLLAKIFKDPKALKTSKLSDFDKGLMAEEVDADASEPVGANEQLLKSLLAPKPGVTGSLSPQGGVTEPFTMTGFKKAQPTQKLTPFEAWKNIVSDKAELSDKATTGLHGTMNAYESPAALLSRETSQLSPSAGNRTAPLEPFDIDEMVGKDSPKTEDLMSLLKQNLGPKDTLPLPENTLYHGLNVFGHAPRSKALGQIAQQGMKGGWFSEEPHAPFGPHFIATTPEDLPPLLIRSKQFNVDPEKEIIPRWKKMNTENLLTKMQMRGKSPRAELVPDTVKGRPATRSKWPNIHQLVGADEGGGGFPLESGGHVVDPSKLFLSDAQGNITGRMAPKGGKPNMINQLWDRVKMFRNVLEEGTGQKASPVDSVFQKLFGSNGIPDTTAKADKIKALKDFVTQEPPENPTLAKTWKPFMDEAKNALIEAGEDW